MSNAYRKWFELNGGVFGYDMHKCRSCRNDRNLVRGYVSLSYTLAARLYLFIDNFIKRNQFTPSEMKEKEKRLTISLMRNLTLKLTLSITPGQKHQCRHLWGSMVRVIPSRPLWVKNITTAQKGPLVEKNISTKNLQIIGCLRNSRSSVKPMGKMDRECSRSGSINGERWLSRMTLIKWKSGSWMSKGPTDLD